MLIKGAQVLDRDAVLSRPEVDWISGSVWDNVTELERRVPSFEGLSGSIRGGLGEWKPWFQSPAPEHGSLPDGFEAKATPFQRLLLFRLLRADRFLTAATLCRCKCGLKLTFRSEYIWLFPNVTFCKIGSFIFLRDFFSRLIVVIPVRGS